MIQSPLDLSALSAFITLARGNGFSGAAAELGVSQPSLTAKIQRLETNLGTDLFDRRQRPAKLTRAGELLLKEAPDLIQKARDLQVSIGAFRHQGPAAIKFGMPDSLSEIMGAECVNALSDLADQVELKTGISPWLETAFRQRAFDYAVDCPPFKHAEDFDRIPLFADPFLIVRPSSMAHHSIEHLIERENRVSYGRTSKFGATCSEIEHLLGVEGPSKFSFDSTQSLLRFVQADYGWAVTSAICLYQSPVALQSIDVVALPENMTREFSLLVQPDGNEHHKSTVAAKFTEIFQQLVEGPWSRTHAVTADHIRSANPALFLTSELN
jgi:DNA-binding transcriptional LysR family regulator